MKRHAGKASLGRLTVAAGAPAASAVSQRSLIITGSDTMLILNQRWAEAYGRVNPRVSVSVAGGGSGIGVERIDDRRDFHGPRLLRFRAALVRESPARPGGPRPPAGPGRSR